MTVSRRGRAVYRLFPKSWRCDGRALEALSIAADAAEDAGRESLRFRQVLDLTGYAISVRAADSVLGLSRRTRAMTAAFALISGLGLSIALFVAAELIPGRRLDDPSRVAPFATLGVGLYVLWVVTAIAVLAGSSRVMLACVCTVLLATVALPMIASMAGLARPSGYDILALWLCAALLLFARRPLLQTPLVARVGVVAAGLVLGAVLAVVLLPPAGMAWSGWGYWGDPQILQTTAWTAIVLLALIAVGSELSRPHSGGLSVSACLAMLPWTVLGAHYRLDNHRMLTVVSVVAGWVTLVAIVVLHRRRRLRRAPIATGAVL